MYSASLQRDHALKIAAEVMRVFERVLRDDEKRDAFEATVAQVLAGLERYEERAERMKRRLRPSDN